MEALGAVKAEYVKFSSDLAVNLKSTEPHLLISLTSVESKQQPIQAALLKIQKLLVAETGKPNIEAMFFINFVVE